MIAEFILTARERKQAAHFALTLIEHMRSSRKVGPQSFPAYKRKYAQIGAYRCIIIIETAGDSTTVTVYNQNDVRMKHPAVIDLACVISHPGVAPPTLIGANEASLSEAA